MKARLGIVVIALGTVAIDASFVLVWALIQWAMNAVFESMDFPTGLASLVFGALRFVFAVATAVPVAAFIYADLRKMLLRFVAEIRTFSTRLET